MKKLLAFLLLCGPSFCTFAAEPGQSLNHLIVQQWVQLSETGELKGKVVTPVVDTLEQIAEAEIALIDMKRHTICTQAETNGEFSFSEVTPGTYGLLVNSSTGAAVYALHVLAHSDSNKDISEQLQVAVGTLSQSMLKRMARSYIPGTQPTEPFVIDQAAQDPLGADRVQTFQHQVASNEEGALQGRIQLPSQSNSQVDFSTLNVVVLKGDEVVARTEAQADGGYRFAKLEPGVYSLLVAGEEGFAVTGFELVSHSEAVVRNSRKNEGDVRFTSATGIGGCCEPALCIEICPVPIADMVGNVCCECEASLESIVIEEEAIVVDDPLMAGYGGGGYGGGGGGFGGGGGGGGGGLGGLGLAGLAAGIAAAVGGGNGGGNAIIVPPPSPAIP
jgi:hypothetical protein